jgi:hypothetical protein
MYNWIITNFIAVAPTINTVSILFNSMIIFGVGNPSTTVSVPTLYINISNNSQWFNAGGSNWTELTSATASQQVCLYTNNPNTEGVVPANPTIPALAYSQNSALPQYTWNITNQNWI